MNCLKCSSENREDALFCNECGASLESQDPRKCSYCNNENPSSAKFCNKCGILLEIPNSQKLQENLEKEMIEKLGRQNEPKAFNLPEILVENGIEFVLIPAGNFIIGSENYFHESPAHLVTIRRPFYFSKFPITQKQWRDVIGNNPSHFKGDDLPVETVSWEGVQVFVWKLNEMEGTDKYRLPSEAEWEYASRAGTTTRYYFGDDESKLGDYAWYRINSGSETHPLGQKKPNPWGLYDMYGNVHEWVQDRWHSNYTGAPSDGSAWEDGDDSKRVIRGGSWTNSTRDCCSACRDKFTSTKESDSTSFRILRETITETTPKNTLLTKPNLGILHNCIGFRD